MRWTKQLLHVINFLGHHIQKLQPIKNGPFCLSLYIPRCWCSLKNQNYFYTV